MYTEVTHCEMASYVGYKRLYLLVQQGSAKAALFQVKQLQPLVYLYQLHYWAVQAGLLTPLTFARHRLSPLAAFTSGEYFLHKGRR